MYDVQPGQPYTTSLSFFDGNGSPITSGITGTMTLYSPSSTTLIDGPDNMTHLGAGRWGVQWSGDLLSARGTHRWTTSAITGAATLAAQSGDFVVGVGDAWTLRELFTIVRRALRDGWTGTTSGSGNVGGTTLVSTDFAYGSNNAWLASQLFLFEPQSVTDRNPVRVTAFTASTGTFTFTPAITQTVSGLDFILGNRDGQKWSHEEVIDAITTAVRRAGLVRPVTDRVSLTAVSDQTLYNLPAGWLTLDGIDYLVSGTTDDWRPISNIYIKRGTIGTDGAFGLLTGFAGGQALRLRGRSVPTVPDAMGGYVAGDGATMRDDALFELLLMSKDGPDRQRAAALQGAVYRARAAAALARL
ncbi:MAG: hypothetical protein KBF28_03780 [Gemmatimonadales bacterium]|nr:hypothetical protein [Gemmatimonadales bacterium]